MREKYFYEFGQFRLDPELCLLLRDGEPVALTPKAAQTLLVLVTRRGQVVSKDELLRAVWPDTFVEENTLTVNISAVRKILGDGQNGHRYIETVPRRGYRFVGDVREVWEEGAALLLQRRGSVRVVTEEVVEEGEPEAPVPAEGVAAPPPSAKGGAQGRAGWRPRHLLLMTPLLLALLSAPLFYRHYRTEARRAGAVPGARTIAVLPFKVSPDGDESLGFGIADTLITKLSGIKEITVRPVRAVTKYAGQGHDVLAAGRELGVDAVLDGTVQRAGDQVRVTVRLVSVRSGGIVWSGQFDQAFTNLFAVEDAVARDATEALALALTAEERELLVKHDTENAEAYQLYLKGRYFWNKRTQEGFKAAIEYFRQAIDMDPAYARAYAGLADSYILLGVMGGMAGKEVYPHAKAAALKALELDDTLGETHASLASLKFWYEWDFAGAEREFKRAIELNPNYSTAHHWYAFYLATGAGRPEEAIAEIKRALELDPLSLIINADVGAIYVYAGRYDEAIEQYRKTLEMEPNFVTAHVLLWRAYVRKGAYEEAGREYQKIIEMVGDTKCPDMELGCFYAAVGMRGEALKEFEELKRCSRRQEVAAVWFARSYACLGEKELAFEWLEKSYAAHENYLINLKTDPCFNNLHSDPRFADVLRRIGFPQ